MDHVVIPSQYRRTGGADVGREARHLDGTAAKTLTQLFSADAYRWSTACNTS